MTGSSAIGRSHQAHTGGVVGCWQRGQITTSGRGTGSSFRRPWPRASVHRRSAWRSSWSGHSAVRCVVRTSCRAAQQGTGCGASAPARHPCQQDARLQARTPDDLSRQTAPTECRWTGLLPAPGGTGPVTGRNLTPLRPGPPLDVTEIGPWRGAPRGVGVIDMENWAETWGRTLAGVGNFFIFLSIFLVAARPPR